MGPRLCTDFTHFKHCIWDRGHRFGWPSWLAFISSISAFWFLKFSKVFVTHGGLGSLVEAIYHKAVIVGIPLRFHICKEKATICIFYSQQRPKAKPSPCRKAWVCSVSGLGWDDRFGSQLLQIMTKLMFSWGARREHQKGDGRQGDGGQLGEDPHPVLGQGREACGEGGKYTIFAKVWTISRLPGG